MKIVITILIFISAVIPINAQRITREYNNVSLSEALRQLNEQTEDYTISFLYLHHQFSLQRTGGLSHHHLRTSEEYSRCHSPDDRLLSHPHDR